MTRSREQASGSRDLTNAQGNLGQYFRHYAEPLAREIVREWPIASRRYSQGLVLPVRAESAAFLSNLDAAAETAKRADQQVLVVTVINGEAGGEAEETNRACAQRLRSAGREVWSRESAGARLLCCDNYDLLLLCCFEGQLAFGPKQGVGSARKLGGDVLVGLQALGVLESGALLFTDADACLPRDYFLRAQLALASSSLGGERAVGAVLPFAHVSGGDLEVDQATLLYELWFRCYVAGMGEVGSPYAFPALGSAMVVDPQAYVSVRGFSKRMAGEDYYTLDKLAKLGVLALPAGDAIALCSRRSNRAPFGTGPAVNRLLAGGEEELAFYPAACFDALGVLLRSLARFARVRDLEHFRRELQAFEGGELVDPLDRLGAFAALEDAPRHANSALQLLTRTLEWFDGLRSLRFLNFVREQQGKTSRVEVLRGLAFVPDVVANAPLERQLGWFRDRGFAQTIGVRQSARVLLSTADASLS